MINNSLFKEIKKSNSKILVVTKYWDSKTTDKIIKKLDKYKNIIFGFGENRIENLILKNIDRNDMHFIGNIQSKKIEKIVTFCSTIHSLQNLKHAKLINKYSKNFNVITKVFLQISLDPTKPIGLSEIELKTLIKDIEKLENTPLEKSSGGIKIIGISGMGAGIFTKREKQKEFKLLKKLRDKYLPGKLISAGTSRDYSVALENNIEIVRIGSKILEG